MDPSQLDVIVLNWKTADMSAECGRLALQSAPGARLFIVDNGSGDGSPQRLRQAAPPGTTIVENAGNLGFGGGFNPGIRAGSNPYVLLLNSDAQPVGPAYRLLLEHLASDERLGAIAPQVVDGQGRPLPQLAPEPPAWKLVVGCLPVGWRLTAANIYPPPSGPPRVINWLPGMCATMFRRQALEGIGGFDPGYFLGWEEWDLARRLRAADWKIAMHPGAEVIHEGHGSTPKELDAWRNRHGRQAICHHLDKYHGRGWYTAGRLACGALELSIGLRARLRPRQS